VAKERGAVKELEEYRFDMQYYRERKRELEILKSKVIDYKSRIEDYRLKGKDFSLTRFQLEQLQEEIGEKKRALFSVLAKCERVEANIKKLDQPYKNVLLFKYVMGHSVDDIAEKMNYSSKRIYQLHRQGIQEYERILD